MNNKEYTNVAVKKSTHEHLVNHTDKTGIKIGRFVDAAILEKMERENETTSLITSHYSHKTINHFQPNDNR